MADPPELTEDMKKQARQTDPVYQKLLQAVKKGKKPRGPDLIPYTLVWGVLGIQNGQVCRGERIVSPDGHRPGN